MTHSNSKIEEYSDADFVNQFVNAFKKKVGRKPTLKEVKTAGDLIAKAFVDGTTDSTNQRVKIELVFVPNNQDDSQDDSEEECNIPESVSYPLRELIAEISNPFDDDTPIEKSIELIEKIKYYRNQFNESDWNVLLRYTAFTCFQGLLIRHKGKDSINFYLKWLTENLPLQIINEAKKEAVFVVMKEISIPSMTKTMLSFLDNYTHNISVVEEVASKANYSDFN